MQWRQVHSQSRLSFLQIKHKKTRDKTNLEILNETLTLFNATLPKPFFLFLYDSLSNRESERGKIKFRYKFLRRKYRIRTRKPNTFIQLCYFQKYRWRWKPQLHCHNIDLKHNERQRRREEHSLMMAVSMTWRITSSWIIHIETKTKKGEIFRQCFFVLRATAHAQIEMWNQHLLQDELILCK